MDPLRKFTPFWDSLRRITDKQLQEREEVLQLQAWEDQPEHIKELIKEDMQHKEARRCEPRKYGYLPPIFKNQHKPYNPPIRPEDEENWGGWE